jgi:hypothetical protein
MKTTTKYVCDFCDTAYDTQERCEMCEHFHVSVKEYVAAKYCHDRRYPASVVIEMDDGHMVEFSYFKDLGAAEVVVTEPEPTSDPEEPEDPDNDG